MSVFTRFNLHRNWPVLTAGASFLILFLLFAALNSHSRSPYYHYQIGDKVEYSSLLSQYNKHTTDYPEFLVIAAILVALISLLGLLRIPRYKALLSIFFVILTLLWAGRIFFDSLPRGSTVLKNIQSITFNQSSYRLTLLSNLPPDLDWVERSLLVYECGINSEECTLLQSFRDEKHQLSENSDAASLVVNPETNAVYLQINDQKILIQK